jgi:polysaccharide export outer membrane protein
MKRCVCIALGLLFAAAGCGHAPPPPPPPENGSVLAPQGELSLGPGDTFDVRVFGEPDLSNTYRVGSDGTIDYPLLHQIKVDGMEPHALAALIETRLKEKFLKSPQVSILIREQPSKKVTVIGQVTKPSTYPFQSRMTIMDAIAVAGGFTPIASRNKVTIKRIEGTDEKVYEVPVADIGESKAPNVPVRPGDVITVPERIF